MPKFVELTQPSRRRKHVPGAAEVDLCFGNDGLFFLFYWGGD